jgi:hypothetical protein
MAVDLWQWRAGTQNEPARAALAQLDEYPFDTPVYQELAGGRPLPEVITARAAGNPLAGRADAASLAAAGPGSVTFRPRASQLVQTRAGWSNGQWTLELRRPLAVPSGGGVSLAAGGRCSVAFALWDGAARDRGPQKLISIWNDLELAP